MKTLLLLLLPLFLWAEHASISAYAIDCKTGKVIVDWEGERSLVPASCMKVVTTAAALHLLGPESRFETDLEVDGEIKEGILHGNVIIRGGGDPCLGSGDWEKQINTWRTALEAVGIKEIKGQVVGDATKWEQSMAPSSWLWEDLGNYYGAGASALSFHENMAILKFKPGASVGAAAVLLNVTPASSHLVLKNEVTTGPIGSGDQASIFGSEYSMIQFARGTIPAGMPEFSIKGAIPDPAKLCGELLREALHKSGVKVQGAHFPRCKSWVVHKTPSPTMREIVYWTNQRSMNLYAEHLLKQMGDGTTEAGVRAVTQFWKEQGIDMEGFNMVDGSGLSRKNFMTAQQLVSILVKMKASPYFSQFLTSLPEQEPGIFVKTGSMSSVRCLAGYKGDIAFAIFINNGQDSKAMKDKIDQFKTFSMDSAKEVSEVSSTSL